MVFNGILTEPDGIKEMVVPLICILKKESEHVLCNQINLFPNHLFDLTYIILGLSNASIAGYGGLYGAPEPVNVLN